MALTVLLINESLRIPDEGAAFLGKPAQSGGAATKLEKALLVRCPG